MNTKRQLEQALLRIKELSHALDIRQTIIDEQETNYLKLQKSYYEASAEVTALKQTIRARDTRIERLETAVRSVSSAVHCLV